MSVFLFSHQHHIFIVPWRSGKTTTALYIASRLRTKTLVIVHKAFLADQWRDRAGTHLPGATVSMVGCGDADCTGDVVVATIQTLLSRGLACAAEVGLVIVDEVHRIAAPSFSKVLFAAGLNAPALLGLSATPTRADKLTHESLPAYVVTTL